MTFDMTGSLTSTPTHPGNSISGAGYPPTAQSTPVTSLHKIGGQASLLTTPNLTSDEVAASAHSTPKTSKLSPTSTRGNGEAPRTPTPFKRALAEVYRGREPLSNTPQTPTKALANIAEIINKDMLVDYTDISFNHADLSGDNKVSKNFILIMIQDIIII